MKTKLLCAFVIAAFAATGCKKNEDKKKPETKKPTAGKTTETPKKPTEEPKKAWTGEDTMKVLDQMTAAWNAADWDKFGSFYADDIKMTMVDYVPPMGFDSKKAMMEGMKGWVSAFSDMKNQPQLVLVNGVNYAAIGLGTSKNTGELMGMPATNKEVSHYGAAIGRLDDSGKVVAERHLGDQGTMAAQLGMAPNPMAPMKEEPWPEQIKVVATSSDTETKNVETARKLVAAMAAKDADAYSEMLADDVSFRWVPSKDVMNGKEATVKGFKQYIGMLDTVTKNVKEAWGAGDWVVAVVETKGTISADMMGKKTKGKEFTQTTFEFMKIADGKLASHWVFDNAFNWMIQIGAIDPPKMPDAKDAKAPAKAPAKK